MPLLFAEILVRHYQGLEFSQQGLPVAVQCLYCSLERQLPLSPLKTQRGFVGGLYEGFFDIY
ncbi:MAG TPA: hypothetical protein DCP92_01295 [Nitrospiraceae bacterium]|nr:hypothetical protein [Nitrospiraceae bacterium]